MIQGVFFILLFKFFINLKKINKMNFKFITVLALATLVITSCKKDDNDNGNDNDNIPVTTVGTYCNSTSAFDQFNSESVKVMGCVTIESTALLTTHHILSYQTVYT